MNQQLACGFDASIASLIRLNPNLAFSSVPTSFISHFGASLEWPEWMLEGSNFAEQHNVPREAKLVDSLRIMANLLSRLGEARLVEIMLAWPRFPLESEALAAPDLETAVRSLAVRIDERNATIDLRIVEDKGAMSIQIKINPQLGAFCAIYEQMCLVWLYLVVRSYLAMSTNGRSLLALITVGRLHSDPATNALISCGSIETADEACLNIPPEARYCACPDFKPELWSQILGVLQELSRPSQPPSQSVSEAIADLVNRSLQDHGRVPSLGHVAQAMGRSQRTLARALADAGISYRETVDTVRMKLARELLAKSDASIREISAQLGYSDDTAFVRAFRRNLGMPPDRWRRGS